MTERTAATDAHNGRLGGLTTFHRYGRRHMRKNGRKGGPLGGRPALRNWSEIEKSNTRTPRRLIP